MGKLCSNKRRSGSGSSHCRRHRGCFILFNNGPLINVLAREAVWYTVEALLTTTVVSDHL